MRIGIGTGVTSALCLRTVRTPQSLFRPGDQGFWFDPSDMTSLSQDAAGTVSVTAFGQPVGRVQDRSGNGLHAVQASGDQRPLYIRRPLGGRRNLLALTDNLAAWTSQGSPDTIADGSLGGEPAFRLTDNSESQWEAGIMVLPAGGQGAGPHVLSVRVKKEGAASSAASARVNIFDGTTSQNAGFILNPITGANLTNTSWAYGGRVVTVEDMQDHWRVSLAFTLASGHSITSFAIFPAHHTLTVSSSTAANLGSNTWAAPQIEAGSIATAYQRVTSAADITEGGQPSRLALLNDQINDALVTTLPAGTYTLATADDAGVTILTGQVLSGAFAIPSPARLYGCLAINRALSASETASLTTWLHAKRP